MKLLKMFGLAAIAALMAMAFVGGSTAMATGNTALCEDDPAGGACNDPVKHVHESSTSKAKVLSSAFTVECDAFFLGDVDSASFLATPLVIHGSFTYTNCGECGMFEEFGFGETKVLKTDHEKANVTYEFRIHVECGVFIDCIYNGTGLQGTAKGSLLSSPILNGSVTLTEQTMNKVSGFGCPTTAKLDIQTTPLIHTYIGS